MRPSPSLSNRIGIVEFESNLESSQVPILGTLLVVEIPFCTDRGVEYECRVSAKNAVDFGTPAVATINTPEGGSSTFIDVKLVAVFYHVATCNLIWREFLVLYCILY